MNSSQMIACTNCGTFNDPKAKKCASCGNKFSREQKMAYTPPTTPVPTATTQPMTDKETGTISAEPRPDLEVNLVADTPYAGAKPAIFKIKRKGSGTKLEIKDERNKKIFEAKSVVLGFRNIRKIIPLVKDLKAGKIVETTLLTLQNSNKSASGDISMVANYPHKGFISTRINNAAGHTLLAIETPEYLFPGFLGKSSYISKEPVDTKQYQLATRSESFHLEATYHPKRNWVEKLDILDSTDQVCLSVIQQNDDQFAAMLLQKKFPFQWL